MPFSQLGAIFLCGVGVSAFGNIIGFGGGVFMIPLLVIGFRVPIHFAVGAVVSSLLPAALVASYFNFRSGLVDAVAGLALEVPTIIGTLLGVYLTSLLSVKHLELVFGLFLLLISLQMLLLPKRENVLASRLNGIGPKIRGQKQGSNYEIGLGAASFFGLLAGMIAGLFGIGGGFLKTPIMIRVFRMPPKVAVGTALFMIIFTSSTAILSHAALGHIKPVLSATLIVAFTTGAVIGNSLKHRFSDLHTEKMVALGLLIASVVTLIHVF